MIKLLLQLNSLIMLNIFSVIVAHADIMGAQVVLADRWEKQIAGSILRLQVIFAVLFWVGVLITQGVQANDLSGSDDPALQAAIEVWLEDDDENSLPVIANLAGEGNIAARLLLARIEDTDRAPSDYVSSLSRTERVNLFRSTSGKGVFRPSWLKSEMLAGNKIASAFLKSSALEVNIDAIRHYMKLASPKRLMT